MSSVVAMEKLQHLMKVPLTDLSFDLSLVLADVALAHHVTFVVLDELQQRKVLCFVFILSCMEDVAMETS